MRTTGLLLVAMLIGVSAFAQSAGAIVPSPGIDLSGNWAPAVHEDQPDGPGGTARRLLASALERGRVA